MNFYKKVQAYSLAEIMVVLLVLTIIFAATAPFITKRRVENKNNNIVWNLGDVANFDAYTYGRDKDDSAQLFFGVTPVTADEIRSLYSPLSKLVIRSGPVTTANEVQRQIQFRYGYSGYGKFAGTWLMDGRNALLGGEYNSIETTTAQNNTAIGYKSLNDINRGRGNTAVGANALSSLTDAQNNTAIGANAGGASGNNNTFIGANAGKGNIGDKNTFIGYNSASSGATGEYNTFIGANSGAALTSGNSNLAVGHNALKSITIGDNNIAIGAGALENLVTGDNNVAIGAGACKYVLGSNKTCIGAGSGPYNEKTFSIEGKQDKDKHNYAWFLKAWEDDVPRTYIGSTPINYGGDAVLEIHNPESGSVKVPNSPPNTSGSTPTTTYNFQTTTVINGNLIVNGDIFFTSNNSLHKMKPDVDFAGTKVFGSAGVATAYPTDVFSDRRLKNIGTKFSVGLEELSKIKVYNYTFKNDKNKKPHVGVIAQELQKVFPTAVFVGEDGYLRIRWDEMFYAAINAVKELDKKISAIAHRILNVEAQISQLEEENIVLQTQVDQLSQRINKLKSK